MKTSNFAKYVNSMTVEKWNNGPMGTICTWPQAPYQWKKAAFEDTYADLWKKVKDGELTLPDGITLPEEYEDLAFPALYPPRYTGATEIQDLDNMPRNGALVYWNDRDGVELWDEAEVADEIPELYEQFWADWVGVPATTFIVEFHGQLGVMLSFTVGYPSELVNAQDKLPIDLGYAVLKTKAYALTRKLALHAPNGVAILFGKDTIQDMYEIAFFIPSNLCEYMLGKGCADAVKGVKKVLSEIDGIEAQMRALLDEQAD